MTLALLYIAQHVSDHTQNVQGPQDIYHTQNVQEPQDTTRLQKHTHTEPHTTHNIGIALTTRYIN